MNQILKYRTLDQLISEVRTDFRNYALENLIETQDLIKVARRVNRDLGLRIYTTKAKVLDIEKNKVKLPDDFYVMNFALICGTFIVTSPAIQGTQLEERPCPKPCGCPQPCNCSFPVYQCAPPAVVLNNICPPAPEPTPCNPCPPNSCQLNKCGDEFQLVQVVKLETRLYKEMYPLKIRRSPDIDCDCPNLSWTCPNEGWIQDGWLFTSFPTGKVFINYQGILEDESGNLLVPDDEIMNEYYEYALKDRILENLWMNGEDVERKLMYNQTKLRAARNNAVSLVNTPNFEEMRKVWEINRKAQYAKYFDMFRSCPPYWYKRNLGSRTYLTNWHG